MRKNVDIRVVMFNNRIYGLTKGQASPTSELGQKTKSTPIGSIDYPIHPLMIALAAEASFVARTVDTQVDHIQGVMERAGFHRGSAFVEVLQNCNIFNDGAHRAFTDRDVRDDRMLVLEHGKPMIFGKNRDKGIRLDGLRPEVVRIGEDGITEADILVHDETSARTRRSTTCSPGSTGRSSRCRSGSSATSRARRTTSWSRRRSEDAVARQGAGRHREAPRLGRDLDRPMSGAGAGAPAGARDARPPGRPPTVAVLADDLIWATRLVGQLTTLGARRSASGPSRRFRPAGRQGIARSAARPGPAAATAVDRPHGARLRRGRRRCERAAAAGLRVLAVGQHDDLAAPAGRPGRRRRARLRVPQALRGWPRDARRPGSASRCRRRARSTCPSHAGPGGTPAMIDRHAPDRSARRPAPRSRGTLRRPTRAGAGRGTGARPRRAARRRRPRPRLPRRLRGHAARAPDDARRAGRRPGHARRPAPRGGAGAAVPGRRPGHGDARDLGGDRGRRRRRSAPAPGGRRAASASRTGCWAMHLLRLQAAHSRRGVRAPRRSSCGTCGSSRTPTRSPCCGRPPRPPTASSTRSPTAGSSGAPRPRSPARSGTGSSTRATIAPSSRSSARAPTRPRRTTRRRTG